MEQADAEYHRGHPNSRLNSSRKAHQTEKRANLRTDGHSIVQKLAQEANNRLDDIVIDIAEHSVVEALET